jgi:hypothetical protein
LADDLGKSFQAQPWTIAARTFHVAGDFSQANELIFRREWYFHKSLRLREGRFLDKAWDYTEYFFRYLNLAHGYGYRLLWPFLFMAVLLCAGVVLYQEYYAAGYLMPNPGAGGTAAVDVRSGPSGQISSVSMTANDTNAANEVVVAKAPPSPNSKYPKFYSLTYSLDVMLPVVHFSQEEYWVPGYGTRNAEEDDRSGWWLFGLWVFYWMQGILGYAGTAVIGLGLVGYLERRPPA